VNRNVYFNSPFLLGFEHLERLLERTAKSAADGYPPYNIEQSSEESLRITLAVAGFILGEAGLSYLGVGIKLPTSSWGNLLQQASDYYTTQPWLMVWPGLAVLITTLAFNLLGDGLRDALDQKLR